MTAQSSRAVTIKAGGAAEALAAEATTDAGDHLVYQITSAAKRALDPETAVEVFVSGNSIAAANYAVDYAHGVITFADEYGGASAGPVTVTGKYLPLLTIAHAKSLKIVRPSPVFADTTQLGHTAPHATEIAKQCSVDLTHISKPVFIDDPVYSFDQLYSALRPMFLEVDLSGAGTAGHLLRGWFATGAWGRESPINGVGTSTISLKGVCQTCVGRDVDQALFSIR